MADSFHNIFVFVLNFLYAIQSFRLEFQKGEIPQQKSKFAFSFHKLGDRLIEISEKKKKE